MSLTLIFWILMLLWLVAYGAEHFGGPPWSGRVGGLLLFLLFLTLGWGVFGAPIKG